MSILTVTLNPALDLETRTPHLEPGEKLRCAEPSRDPGGGGINVARAICQLGGTATALVAAGGAGGATLEAMLRDRGVPVEHVPAPGELRQNLSVIETETGAQFRFIFPGPSWSPDDVALATDHLVERAGPADWLVLSGSMPPGVNASDYLTLVRRLAGTGVRVVADTSGAALRALSEAPDSGLHVLRMDREESEKLAGAELSDVDDSAALASDLVARGVAKIVIIARGSEGSVLVSAEGRWSAPAADVPVRSRTGAGDSFVAGAVLALSQGQPLPKVLQQGCASASAACTTEATELCDLETVRSLLPQSVPTPL